MPRHADITITPDGTRMELDGMPFPWRITDVTYRPDTGTLTVSMPVESYTVTRIPGFTTPRELNRTTLTPPPAGTPLPDTTTGDSLGGGASL